MPAETIAIIIISALIGLFLGLAIGKLRERPLIPLIFELGKTKKMLKAAVKVNHLLVDMLYEETGKQVNKLPFPQCGIEIGTEGKDRRE